MGFDDLKNKAQDMLGGNKDKVEQGMDKASDMAKDKFGHEEQVDQATEKARGFLGNSDEGNRN